MKNTYADQANKILKKYKLRLGKDLEKHDPLAMQGLEQEMKLLQEKQEAFKRKQQSKVANKFMNNTQGMSQYAYGNPYEEEEDLYEEDRPAGANPELYRKDSTNTNNSYYADDVNYSFKDGIATTPTSAVEERKLDPYNPVTGGASPIPLAASLAGSYLMYKGADESDINYDRVSPEEIDLSSERAEARRQAELTRNISSRNARNLGLNAGAAATLGTASQADIQGKLGATVGKSYLNEELANSQARQRANQINADIAMREQNSRLREKDAVTSFRQQAIQDAIGSMSKYFGDVQKGRQFNAYLNSKDQIYNRYKDPEQNWVQRTLGPKYITRANPEIKERYN